jgi:predicted 3-demethylubiquinone-9 3-methyltransferase (glyoxalase superfamily)
MCGWCIDKYELWRQIVPRQLGELMGDPDSKESQRACQSHAQEAEDYRRRDAKDA